MNRDKNSKASIFKNILAKFARPNVIIVLVKTRLKKDICSVLGILAYMVFKKKTLKAYKTYESP